MANPIPAVQSTLPAGSPPVKLLFRVRLKDKHDLREVVVSARDLATASQVGEAYCAAQKYRFIRCESMVVADESIL